MRLPRSLPSNRLYRHAFTFSLHSFLYSFSGGCSLERTTNPFSVICNFLPLSSHFLSSALNPICPSSRSCITVPSPTISFQYLLLALTLDHCTIYSSFSGFCFNFNPATLSSNTSLLQFTSLFISCFRDDPSPSLYIDNALDRGCDCED